MVNLLKTNQKKLLVSALIVLFIGPLFGLLLQVFTSASPIIQPLGQNSLQSSWTIADKPSLEALSNTTSTGGMGDIAIAPTENITGATLRNFFEIPGYNFLVQDSIYTIDFSMQNVTLSEMLDIDGSPKIQGNKVSIGGIFESNSYLSLNTIGSPILILNNVNASLMRFRVSGGTFSWSNSNTTSLTLDGFTTALLTSDIITGNLTVGTGIVTIINTQIEGNIFETVDPTVIPTQNTFVAPYSFVFQPKIEVEISWTGSDNIQGPNYGLTYNLTLYRNGLFQETIPNILTSSYRVPIDTTAGYYEVRISCADKQGNVSTATISIVLQPDLLWFILMLVIIAGAAVGTMALLYWRKQRQWQKTALVEIPA